MFLEFDFTCMVLFPVLKSKKSDLSRTGVWTMHTPKWPYQLLFSLKPRRSLWIMYYHVLHDSKHSAQVWCRIQIFARVYIKTVTPKRPYQLFFRLKPAPSALNHVSPCNTWFQVLGASLMQNPRFRKGLHHNVPVTLNICTGQAVQNNTTTTGAKCS